MNTKQDKLAAIKKLKSAIKNVGESQGWICLLLKPFIGQGELGEFINTWPLHSGNYFFPVPSPIKGKNEEDIFYISVAKERLWTNNEYGDLRRDLARHIINELKKEIEND